MGGYPKKQQPMYQPIIKPGYSGQGNQINIHFTQIDF